MIIEENEEERKSPQEVLSTDDLPHGPYEDSERLINEKRRLLQDEAEESQSELGDVVFATKAVV